MSSRSAASPQPIQHIRQLVSVDRKEPAYPAGELGDLAHSFVRQLRARGRAETTIAAYVEAVARLDAFLSLQGMPRALDGLKREHVESFIGALLTVGRPASALARYRALQQYFKFAEEEGEIERSPMARMHPPHVPESPPPVLSTEDLKRLTATCAGKDFADRRDLAVLTLLLDTGLRRAELAGLQLVDLDLDRQLAIVLGKGRRQRAVPFGRKTALMLDRYLRARARHERHELPWLWLGRDGRLTHWGIAQVLERRAAQAGLEHINLHRFRHTFAHEALLDGMQEGDVMQLAGWRSRQMLGRYGASAAAERARAAFRSHSLADRL